jgi:hypothetical protein
MFISTGYDLVDISNTIEKFQTQINHLSGLGQLLGAEVFTYLHTYVHPPLPLP